MKKTLKIVANVLAWVLLIFVFLITLVVFTSSKNNGVSNIFGFMPMTVQSDSMKPTFSSGDLIIVKEVDDLYSLKEGDVITFYTVIEGRRVLNTHRIVNINKFDNSVSFSTRGDNNHVDDDLPAYASDIVGKWTGKKIGGAGNAMDFLRTKKGFFICVLLPMILFFLFELYKFIVALIEVKKPSLTADDEEEIKRKAIEEYLAKEKAAQENKEETAVESPAEAKDSAETVEKAEAES